MDEVSVSDLQLWVWPLLIRLTFALRAPVTSEVLTSWYQERAREIEQYAGQVGLGRWQVGLGRGAGRPGEGH